jgi:CO dehydrogenase/acetyl-CoA synthase alpha subunit
MIDFYEFQIQLRNLARRADDENMSRQSILESIIDIANEYLDRAEEMELQMIISEQNDPSNPRYDCELVSAE